MTDPNYDIWRMQAQNDTRGLIDLLKSPEVDLRKRAAMALRALGASSAIPALQMLLVAEGDPEVRMVLISTLDSLFQQEMDEDGENQSDEESQVVRLIAQLNSSQYEHIIRAAQTLAEMKEKIAAEALMMVFYNKRLPAQVRLAAAEALIKLESAPVEVTLLAALRNKDWHTRRNAAAVLGQLNADWAVEPLSVALRDTQEIVRRTAYAALKRINTPEAQRAIAMPTAQTRPLGSTPNLPAHPVVESPIVPAPIIPKKVSTETQPALSPAMEDPTATVERVVEMPKLPLITAALVDEDTQPTPPMIGDDVS
ncbi:MAG: HEAT repeat domain-containing protein [Anaerolineae bacterium]|nr:HEAT repeat domain-containing protein [Anaerolineae bacterium]